MSNSIKTNINEIDELVIPNCLLEAAEIPSNSDLDIRCVPGSIIIGSTDPLFAVPSSLMNLFDDLGISHAAVRRVLMEEGD